MPSKSYDLEGIECAHTCLHLLVLEHMFANESDCMEVRLHLLTLLWH